MYETTARRRLTVEASPTEPMRTPGKTRTHKAVCAKCLRPLDIWPDGMVLHQDARFDMAVFPEHHEATELP